MTTLMEFFGSPFAHGLLHALGWTLLHFCWQGAIIATVLWCALQLLTRRSSQVRYFATCLAFLTLITLPLLTFAHLAAAVVKSGQTTWNSSITIDPSVLLQVSTSDIVAPWPARMAVALDHRMPWLLAVWLAGAIYFVARLNYGLLVAIRLKSAGTEAPTADFSEMFDGMTHRLGIHRVVRLLHSARVQVPTVVGWLRPVVLIPASCLTGLSTEQIEAIFCHELAHVRRHDYLISVFQSIAEALLFYHPAVWWISKQVRRERECCCDEIAVANGGDVLAYAKALSYLEERRAAFPEFVLGANGGVLSMRIKRLLGYKSDTPASQFAALALLALMITIAGSYVATLAHAAQPKPKALFAIVAVPLHAIGLAQEQAPSGVPHDQPLHAQYKTWLEQDALYLITPEERAAYLQLKNDDERDKFIEQFWTRRDSPNSEPGTFRQGIYARFAYSNQHFASDTKPGWTTDRGRTYIVYGKPDSIDVHPSWNSETNTPPFDVWHYRTTGGQQIDMRFVDTAGDGNYHLISTTPASKPTAVNSILPNGNPRFLDSEGSVAEDQVPAQPHYGVATDYNGAPLRKIGSGVSSPVVIYQVEPEFSEQARKAKFMGMVLLNLVVDQSGQPQNVHVLRGVGMGLDEKAVEAVKQYKFKPAMENGNPVAVALNIEVNFQIFDKPPALPAAAEAAKTFPAIAVNSLPLISNPSSGTVKPDLAVRKIGGGVTSPIVTYQVPPSIPLEARREKFMAVVLVNLIVDQRGRPQNVHVIRGVGKWGLDESAVAAVRQYRFKPAIEQGKPVPVELNVEVNFQIF